MRIPSLRAPRLGTRLGRPGEASAARPQACRSPSRTLQGRIPAVFGVRLVLKALDFQRVSYIASHSPGFDESEVSPYCWQRQWQNSQNVIMDQPITPESERILKLLLEIGTIRGFELKRRAGLQSPEFVQAVRPLIYSRFITASGDVSVETADRVQFAPLSGSFERLSPKM